MPIWKKLFMKWTKTMEMFHQSYRGNGKNIVHDQKECMKRFGQELTFFQANQKLKKQVQESRKLVADQLLGVSEVMDNFAKEIQRERENHHKQEEQIMEAIQAFGIHIEHVEIYSLEQGNVDIEMSFRSAMVMVNVKN